MGGIDGWGDAWIDKRNDADNIVVWQDDQIWQGRPSLRRMTSGKERGTGQLCHPSVLVSSMWYADANPTSQGNRSPYSRLCAGWMMGNETIAEKESDAWMMRLAKTMRRVAERVGWYYILRGLKQSFRHGWS